MTQPIQSDVTAVRQILHAHQRAMTPPDSGWGDMSYLTGSYDHLPVFQAALKAYRALSTGEGVSAAWATTPDRETVARIIDPSSWRVLDSYLERVKRHHPHGGYDPDNFTDKVSLAKADAILALFATPSSCVLVPLEATMPMLVAATSRDQGPDDSLYASIYRAMVQAALRGRGEGGAGEGQGVTTETERGNGSLPVPSPQQYHAGDASRRAAFRAGWYVNAAEPPDQTEEYLAACEAADYRDYCASQDAKQ